MKRTTIAALACMIPLCSSGAMAGDIDPGLESVFDATPEGETVSALVYLWDQGDVPALKQQLDGERASLARRNLEVVRHLQDTAELAQDDLLAELALLEELGRIERIQSFWIANIIRVDAPEPVLRALADRPDVMRIYYNIPIGSVGPIDDEVERGEQPAQPEQGGIAGGGPEPGIEAVRAPEVWNMGFTGSGVLVATLDTGVDGNHPAVGSRWRGHSPLYANNPEWAWFDPVTGTMFPQEFAFSSHGTHTMGTVLGGAPGDQVGVAPGAEWIHAAVIDRVNIETTIADAISAFQWLAAPTGEAGQAWAVPRLASNSWGTLSSHGHPACDESFWNWIDNGEAAGTAHFFAAGNEGSGGLRRPADRAVDPYRSLAVAAVNANNPSWPIASFSSLGPTMCTVSGDPAIKPDIAAPGDDVRSSIAGGGYQLKDGTSMAVPHINGVAALMLEACDVLTADEIKQIIYDTAHDLGLDGKDNTFGWGMVDAVEAVNQAIAQCTLGLKLPEGVPSMLDPGQSASFLVEVVEGTENLVLGSEMLFYRYDGGDFISTPLKPLGELLYEATLPPPSCGDVAEFYVQVEGDGGSIRTVPSQAPQSFFSALVGEFVTDQVFHRDFSEGLPNGWSMTGLWHVTNSCSLGGSCEPGPLYAYYGQSSTCNFDTGSANQGVMQSEPITFPSLGPGESAALRFCYNLEKENSASYDIPEFSILGTGFQQTLAQSSQWTQYSVDATPFAGQTHALQWKFNTVDSILNNFHGWQIDQVRIEVTSLFCEDPSNPADLTGDGSVGVEDLLVLLGQWGECDEADNCPADLDGDDLVGVGDLLILLENWG